MLESSFFLDLIKYLGFPALIFLVWYLSQRNSHQQLMALIERFSVESERQYETLKEILETQQHQLTALVRMESKIDSAQYCPVVRERGKIK